MHTWASSHGLLTFTLCIWQEWPLCFSPINQRAPLKKKTHHPLNANTSVFRCSSGVCGTRVWFRAQRYRETGPCGQCQFPWFPSVKGRFSLGLACLWSPREKMALCPEIPGPLWAEFLCDSDWVGVVQHSGWKGKRGEKTQKQHVWVLGSAPRIT